MLSLGTTRLSIGATAQISTSAAITPLHPRVPNNAPGPFLSIGEPSLEREHSLRPFLDEDDDEDEHRDLGEHRARDAFKEFVDDSKAHRGVHRSGELAYSAKHDDHERVDDVTLAQIGP